MRSFRTIGRRGVMLAGATLLTGCATPRTEDTAPAEPEPTDPSPAAPADSPSPSSTAGVHEVPAELREQADALMAGGVVLYLRHPATTRGGTDSPDWPRERQRLLSAEGEQQARDLGEAFKVHGWQVHEVLSSPSWRCRDAADLAFGDYRVEPLLTGLLSESGETEDALRAYSQELVRTQVPAGRVLVAIGHSSNIRAATEASVSEGAGVITRVDDGGEVQVVGTVDAQGWAALK
ncbi:MAG TPA: histidine phosphatase family protein [Propionibacterium sp.]|nr:histidine phosphatase family protein [Propionibacterium sp.]